VIYRASTRFWRCYRELPADVRELADRCFGLLKKDTAHPSLHFKKVNAFRSVRIGLHYRALAVESDGDTVWFWIGSHAEYDILLGRSPANPQGQSSRRKWKPARATRRRDR
jgi:hypothetical protein